MTKRRSKGDGGLTQRKDGRWQASLPVDLPNGHTKRRYFYGKTKAEAKGKLDAALRDKRAGTLVAKSPTVADWMAKWLEMRRRPPKPLKPNTWNGYAEKIRNYIVPALGKIYLDRLRPRQIEAMYDEMRDRGLAESTVRQTHAILKKALTDAVRGDALGITPMDKVNPPGTETNKREQFTLEQATRALGAAGESARWWLALFYGLRQGEALGMRWEDVDWKRKALSVVETRQSDYGGGKRIQGTPKSQASRRTLPMVGQIEARMRLHWEAAGRPETGHVFVNGIGKPLDPAADWKAWRAMLDSASVVPWAPLPYIALHAARNTAASLMEAVGIPDRVVAQILGHSQVRMTHRYTDAEIERLRAVLERAEALVSPPRAIGGSAPEPRPAATG